MGLALITNCNSDKILYLINNTALFTCIYYDFLLYSQKMRNIRDNSVIRTFKIMK